MLHESRSMSPPKLMARSPLCSIVYTSARVIFLVFLCVERTQPWLNGALWQRLLHRRASVAAGEQATVALVIVLDARVLQVMRESTGFTPVVSALEMEHGS